MEDFDAEVDYITYFPRDLMNTKSLLIANKIISLDTYTIVEFQTYQHFTKTINLHFIHSHYCVAMYKK